MLLEQLVKTVEWFTLDFFSKCDQIRRILTGFNMLGTLKFDPSMTEAVII